MRNLTGVYLVTAKSPPYWSDERNCDLVDITLGFEGEISLAIAERNKALFGTPQPPAIIVAVTVPFAADFEIGQSCGFNLMPGVNIDELPVLEGTAAAQEA